MAHEVAHVALRHGTQQASKAYLAQTGDRETRIRQLAATLPRAPARKIGGLQTVQAELRGMPAAPASQLAQAQRSPGQTAQPSGRTATVQVRAPSLQFKTFNHPTGFFSIEYPPN